MLTLYSIKTPQGYYVTDRPENKSYDRTCIKDYLVNGRVLVPTFHSHWFITQEFPQNVQRKETKIVNRRFELTDPETFSNLPQVYLYEDVYEGLDNDDCAYFSESFEKIKSLYEFKSDRDYYLVNVAFDTVELAEVDLVPGVVPFAYKAGRVCKITEKDVQYPVLTQITVPSLLHPATPCFLSPKDTYDIIRHHVKQHINLDVAEVSSDYDFCFSVTKLIERYEPEKYKVDVNNPLGGRRKPKYETRYRKDRGVKVLAIAPAPRDGYKVVEGFSANNQAELAKVIEEYLHDLMSMINEPLKDCPHCQGMGVIHKV